MKVLNVWSISVSALGACEIRDILKDGETQVSKCVDEYGNFIVRIEQTLEDGSYQAASVVFGRHEEAEANYACIMMLKEQHPFIRGDWKVYVDGCLVS
jgi:GH43 family beta-xylosidase